MMKQTLKISLLYLSFALMMPPLSLHAEAESEKEEKPKPVEIEGIFEATQATAIRVDFEKSDKLEVLEAVEHGQNVIAGEVLIVIDSDPIEKAFEAAKSAFETAKTELADAEIQMELAERSQRLALQAAEEADRIAMQDLKEFLTNGKQTRTKGYERSVESAENRLAYQREELNQLVKMYEADDLTEETEEIILRRTRDAVKSAEYSLEMTRESRRKGMTYSLEREGQQLETAVARAALSLEEARRLAPQSIRRQKLKLEAKRRSIEEQEITLAQLQQDLQAVRFEAPHDGTIYFGSYRNGKWSDAAAAAAMLEPGAALKNKTIPMTVVKLRPLQVRMMVPETSLRHMELGTLLNIESVAFPSAKIAGRVSSIARIPTANKYECVVEITGLGDEERIVPGMTAKVTLAKVESE